MFTIIDPLSFVYLFWSEALWIGGGAVLLLATYKIRNSWAKASIAAFALAILSIHLLAVVPSWWLYYADANLGWGGNGCVAIDAQCIKQSIKDTVVVVQNAAVLGGFVVAFVIYQRKFPKQLAPGEAKPEATGGYK